MAEQISEEQRARGYIAEARFFHEVAQYYGSERPVWFIGVERAPPHLDLYGIDGFAWVRRFLIFVKRIPLQVKTRRADMNGVINSNNPVYVLTHRDMEPRYMMRNLAKGLAIARGFDFEPYIQSLERRPIGYGERIGIARIEQSRRTYNHFPARQ